MFTTEERDTIRSASKFSFINDVQTAFNKDKTGCNSHKIWTLAWDQMIILISVSNTETLDDEQLQCLYERLIDFNQKNNIPVQ